MDGLRVFLFVALSAAVKNVGSQGYSSTAVATGANITVECDAVDSAVYGITWLIDSDPVESLNDSRLVASHSQLTITHFSASHHTGYYSCLVEASADGAISYRTCPVGVDHASISAQGFMREPKPTTAMVGDMTVLYCDPPPSKPPPTVMWKKEGLYLNPSVDSRLTIMPSGNLYITNITEEDEGNYRCVAMNPVTGAKRRSEQIMLTVTDVQPNDTQPSFLVVPQNTTAEVGDKVVLECAGRGSPPPLVEWYREHSRHFPHTGKVLPVGALVFDSITSEDTGLYHCGVSNDVSEIQAVVFVDVREPPTFAAVLPELVNVTIGNNIMLTCEVTGSATLQLFLYHNGQLLRSTSERETSRVNITFTVAANSQSDSGIYQCLAMNDIRCVQTQTVVMVTDPPQQPEVPTRSGSGEMLLPTLVLTPTELVLIPGQPAPIICEPSPGVEVVRWQLTHQEETDYFNSTFFDGTLYWLLLNQPGVYVCIGVHNSLTPVVSNEVHVTVMPLDVMVTNDKLEVTSGDPVEIQCKAIGGNGGLQVDWLYKDEMLPAQSRQTADGGILSVLKLNPAYAGEFVCLASILSGESLSVSVSVIVVVPPPRSPPANVVVSLLPGFLLVEWQPPEDNINKLLYGYKVAYDMTWRVHKTARHSLQSSVRNFTIPLSHLSPLSAHTLLLWAYTLGGDGPEVVINLNQFDMPPPLTTMTAVGFILECDVIDSTAILSWEGDVSAHISYGCDEITTGNKLTVPMTTTPHYITGLLPNCTYTFEVQRSMEMDTSQCSARTQPAEVDINVEVERYSNGSIQLLWHHLSELSRDFSEVSINWGMGWNVVEPGLHFPAHFDPQQEYQVQLRFRAGQWEGFKTVTIPRAPSTTSPSELPGEGRVGELGLIYGLIFGGLVVACCLVVIVILMLKYIQMTRRDEDKGSNKRELEREEFRRMSLVRSSTISTKNTPSISSTSINTSV